MKRTILLLTFVVTVSCMHAQRMLTLEECRNLAIQNNKELQISGEKIKMADNEKKAAFTKYFPQLSANGAYMWNQKDINLLDMGALSSSLSSSLGGLAQLPMIQHLMSGVNDMQHWMCRISGWVMYRWCSLYSWVGRSLIITKSLSLPSN